MSGAAIPKESSHDASFQKVHLTIPVLKRGYLIIKSSNFNIILIYYSETERKFHQCNEASFFQ